MENKTINEKDPTKIKSYRLTEETHKKIDEIAAEIGGTKDQVVGKLIEVYELQKDKVSMPQRKADIEKFENFSGILTKMYMAIVDEAEHTKELVRVEFEEQMKSKDMIITDLQVKLASEKVGQAAIIDAADQAKAENARLNKYIDEMEEEFETKYNDLQCMLEDKTELNKSLTETVQQQKEKISFIEPKAGKADKLREELETCKEALNKAIREKEQQQLQHEKDMLALEKQLQKEKTEEIEKYRQMYVQLLQKQEQEQPKKTSSRAKKTVSKIKNDTDD